MNDSIQSIKRPKPIELVISGLSAQDLGDRKEQQDRVAILTSPNAPGSALGVLADGMGGRSGGALAAANVILTSERHFADFANGDNVENFFASLVSEVHTVLRLTGVTSGLEPHSTFAAVLLQPDRIDWCHVGDSRIYHIRERKLMHCTSDHTFMQELIQRRQMSAERARLHPSANALVNALGATRAPEPAFGGLIDPHPGDRFLICSDGLWNYFHAGEIVLVIESMPLREATQTLISRARQRAHGRGDNCSLILFKLAAAGDRASDRRSSQVDAASPDLPIVV